VNSYIIWDFKLIFFCSVKYFRLVLNKQYIRCVHMSESKNYARCGHLAYFFVIVLTYLCLSCTVVDTSYTIDPCSSVA